jgi:hypothetical protein
MPGLSGDGHFERWNLSVVGLPGPRATSYDPVAQRSQGILAGFAAAELSRDFDWLRVRGTD